MIHQIFVSSNCDIALNRKILVAPLLIFYLLRKELQPGRVRIFAEQKAVIGGGSTTPQNGEVKALSVSVP